MDIVQKAIAEIAAKYNPVGSIHDIAMDEKIHRHDERKKGDGAIWTVGKTWEYKNASFSSITYGSWRDGEKFKVNSWSDSDYSKKDLEEFKKKQEESKRKLEQEEKLRWSECREKWSAKYYDLPKVNKIHEYIVSKKLASNFQGRVDTWGNLIIPIFNFVEEKLKFVGVQRIYKDKETHRFVKMFSSGVQIKGAICAFGEYKKAEYIYLAEGFATAGSIYQATKRPVICCFNAGNIYKAIQSIRKINLSCKIIICADRDINKNPRYHDIGNKKAVWAANANANCVVRRVKFESDDPNLSDFNDLHVTEGMKSVTDQLFINESEFVEVIPMGHYDKKLYYFVTDKKTLYSLTPTEHNKNQFMTMAPRNYWGERYGYRFQKGGDKMPDWDNVIEQMSIKHSKIGFFNPENIRGFGAWNDDNDKVFVNLGDRIFTKGKFHPIFNNELNTKFFYEANQALDIDFNEELSDDEGKTIIDSFKRLSYKNKNDFVYLTGWIALAQIFGAVPWRPHLWITGSRGSGKTTILEFIDNMLPLSLFVKDSTAAGIKQRLKNNAIPVVYDEGEPNDDIMKKVIQLARECSTRTNSMVLRGTVGGTAKSWNTNSIFCFGSIQKQLFTAADDSRVFAVEMLSTSDQPREEYRKIVGSMHKSAKLKEKLFVRMVKTYDVFLSNFKLCQDFGRDLKIEARETDQIGAILAAFRCLYTKEKVTESWYKEMIDSLGFMKSDYMELNAKTDSEKCFEIILQLVLDPVQSMTVSSAIASIDVQTAVIAELQYDEKLALFGLKFMRSTRQLFVSANNIMLKEKLSKYSEYKDYSSLLKRHSGFQKYDNCWLNGRSIKGIYVSLEDE